MSSADAERGEGGSWSGGVGRPGATEGKRGKREVCLCVTPVFPCGDNRCELADHHADGRNCDLRLLHRTVYVFHKFMADNQNFCFDVFCDVVRLTKVALDLAPSGLRPVRALHSLLISWQSKQVASDIGVIFDRKQSHYIPGEMVAALEERTKGVGARTEALGTPARRGLGGQKRGR